uniref:Uncharacterized protein n=1 Tax=Podoviridae sp. cttxo15 TaxID=2826584 RepID=A0A8S5N2X0_9CAUD|nr:MAG TPA: hypothetical protein [Podoviridae sp. cttxo15]
MTSFSLLFYITSILVVFLVLVLRQEIVPY